MTDEIRIGNNVKIIRKWNGIKQEAMATLLSMSKSNYEKCENGKRKFSDDVIKEISKKSGIPVNYIINGDFSEEKYVKLYFKKEVKFSYEESELMTFSKDILNNYFVFVNSDIDSEYFKKGIKSSNLIGTMNIDVIVDTIINFMRSYKEDQIIEGAVNTLSAFGYLWFFYFWTNIDREKYEEVKDKGMSSLYEVNDMLLKMIDRTELEKSINDFFECYEDIIDEYIKIVRNDLGYYDYAYFYIAMRYLLGIYNLSDNNLCFDQSYMIGINLLESLAKAGNMYASNFLQFFIEKYKILASGI